MNHNFVPRRRSSNPSSRNVLAGKTLARAILTFAVWAAVAVAGCSSSGGSGVSISLSVPNPPSPLLPGGATEVLATVSGTSDQNVLWTVNPRIGGIVCEADRRCSYAFYSAPINISSPVTVSLTATADADKTKSASVSITINSTTSLLYGLFGFQFSGFDADGPVSIAGVFDVDQNGNITRGEEDFKDPKTQNPSAQTISGTCQNLAVAGTGFCKLTAGGRTFQYDFYLRSSFNLARFIEDPVDGLGINGSGIFVATHTGEALLNFFVPTPFGLIGTDAIGGRIGVVGTMSYATASANSPLTGQVDVNDNGVLIQPSPQSVTFSISVPDALGRETLQFTVGSSPQRTFTLAVYDLYSIFNGYPAASLAVDITPATSTANAQVLTGQFFPNDSGTFPSSSISGVDVFDLWATTPGGAATTAIGTLNPSSTPNLLVDVNVGGTINGGAGAATPETGTISGLTVAANGRAQFSTSVNGVNSDYVAYLNKPNNGFLLGTDANVSFGFLQAQPSPPNFSNATITGNYVTGTFLPGAPAVPNVASITTLTPIGQSGSTFSGSLSSRSTVGAYSFDSTTGRGTVSTSTGNILGGNSAVFYIVDPADIVLMGSQQGQANDAIEFFEF